MMRAKAANPMRRKVPIALALLSFTFVTLDVGTGDGSRAFEAVRAASAGVVGPLQEATAGLVRPADRGDELTSLRRDNLRLTAEVRQLRDGRRSYPVRGPVVSARVIALGSRPASGRTAVIDAGRREGVRANSGVANADGLIGRVLRVGPTTSVVVLLNDVTSTVGARSSHSRELGLVRGDGERLVLTTVDPAASVRPGDRLVSWGSQAYPQGIPIGRIEHVSRDETAGLVATVRPASDLTALDTVVVHAGPG